MPIPEIEFYKEAVMWLAEAEAFFSRIKDKRVKSAAKKMGDALSIVFDYVDLLESSGILNETVPEGGKL